MPVTLLYFHDNLAVSPCGGLIFLVLWEGRTERLLREFSSWLFVVETFLRAPRDEVIRDALSAHRTFTDVSVFLRAPCF
jgi:hypothetical protein